MLIFTKQHANKMLMAWPFASVKRDICYDSVCLLHSWEKNTNL